MGMIFFLGLFLDLFLSSPHSAMVGQKNRFDFDSELARLFPFLFYLFLQAIPLRLASCTLGGIFFIYCGSFFSLPVT